MVVRKHAFIIKIIGLLVFFSIIPLLLLNLIWYRVTTNSLADKIKNQSENMLQQLNLNLRNYINNIEISAISIAFDDDVQKIMLSKERPSEEECLENSTFLYKQLNKAVYNNAAISRITLLTNDYQINSVGEKADLEEFEAYSWYCDFMESGKLTDLTEVYYKDYGSGKKEPTLAYIQRINHTNTNTAIGFIIVEMRYAKVRQHFSDIANDSINKVFVFDGNDIIYSPDGFRSAKETTDEQKDLIKQVKKADDFCDLVYQGNDCILIKKDIVFTGWTVVELIDKEELFSSADSMVNWLLKSIMALVVILIAVAVWMVYHMIKPISQIEDYMKKVEQNQFDVRFTDVSEDEFGRIKTGFNKMIDHIEILLHDIEEKEAEKREITIKALRAQINPHFLYNTLNIIRWRVVMAGNETASNMIVALIQTMEFNGKRKEEFVTVKDEIDNVKQYVQLLKYHYENKFEVIYDVDETAEDCYVCKLILQPLVENAVFHGILPKKGFGKIWVSVKKEDDLLLFEIRDSGVGMSKEQEEKLTLGIGFSNVNDRLKYYFGEEHRIKVENSQGEGVTMRFSIPVILSLPYYRAVMKEGE